MGGDAETIILANLLIINSTVKKLKLSQNNITDLGANALAEAIKQNSSLTKLNLKRNSIENNGAEKIGKALKKNRTLTKISINGTIPIKKFRDGHTKFLDLSNQRYKDSDAIIIASMIVGNSTLTKLNLKNNYIGDIGMLKISKAMKIN